MGRLRQLPPLIVVSAFSLFLMGFNPQAGAAAREVLVWHLPPGLVVRGERVTLDVNFQTSDPYAGEARGDAYFRGDPKADFTRVRMTFDEKSLESWDSAGLDWAAGPGH